MGKVYYFIYNERPMSPLFKSQVLPLLIRASKEQTVCLVYFTQFWFNFNFKNNLRELKKLSSLHNFNLKLYPFAVPERMSQFFLIEFLTKKIFKKILSRLLKNQSVKIIHVRGYIASFYLSTLKNKFDFKFIFDGRSLYPYEGITRGLWNKDSKAFNSWKNKEKKILKNSDYTICINQEIKDYYDSIILKNNIVIPLMYSFRDDKILSSKLIELKNCCSNKNVFIYSGSLMLNFWNDLDLYTRYFIKIRKADTDSFFIIATNSDHEIILNYLQRNGLNKSSFFLLNASKNELKELYNISKFGLQLMPALPDGFSRLGVKTIEYLFNDLIVMVNDNCGSAKNLVINNNHGFVLNLDDSAFEKKYHESIKRPYNNRKKKFTEFSEDSVLSKYEKLYKILCA